MRVPSSRFQIPSFPCQEQDSQFPVSSFQFQKAGFAILKILLLLCLLFAIGGSLWFVAREKVKTRRCTNNFHRIYEALEMYEIERGTLPRLAFYPDDPKQDEDSIAVALAPFGGAPEIFVCPSAPNSHRELGLTYIWNVRLNGRKLQRTGEPTWMLVELNALSEQLPACHLGKYNILYTDGTIHHSAEPPPGLRDM